MNIIELFAGSRSVGKVADSHGHKCFSIDIKQFPGIDLVKDIILLQKSDIPFIPDFIWASPVCNAWSKTGWFHYWNTNIYASSRRFVAKKEFANESVRMVEKTIEIFSWFPRATYFMENPEGMLYRHPVMNNFIKYDLHKKLRRELITYCSYGDTIRKPTHIWTNSATWIPNKPCNNGDPCHSTAPRCSLKGMYERTGNYDRSIIPEKLINQIFLSM